MLFLAQETTGANYTSLVLLALLVVFFYFLIIRPQRKRTKAQQELVQSLAAGQEVRTIGGIHGTIVSMDEDSVVLRVEDGRIRVSKRAIGSRVGEST